MIKILLAILFFFIVSTNISFAQEKMSSEGATIITPSPMEYQLPYPGLLPDSPLYFIKTLRDRIIDFLVADPLKKAELDLLQADKRLAAGVALIEKGNGALSESTIAKGENYFEEAITKVKEAKKQGTNVTPMITKLTLAAQTHQDTLKKLEKKSSGKLRERFHALVVRMEKLEKEVGKIR